MPEVDGEILTKASRGLAISFIICISVINILLVIKTAFKKGFIYCPRSLTIISLALGDIFLALYGLVIYCVVLFEAVSYSCRLLLSFWVYVYFILHCVYGVGLIVLAVEMVIRHKRRSLIRRKPTEIVIALICSLIPWIVGLGVVIPLTLVGTDWESCTQVLTPERSLARYYGSVIIPAGLAVIVCVVASCIPSTPREVIYESNTQTGEETNKTNAYGGFPTNSTTTVHVMSSQNDTFGVQNGSVNQISHGEQEQPLVVHTGREKIVLVLTSIVFFLCVVPNAAFTIHLLIGIPEDLTVFVYSVMVQGFYWLSVFRSLITPLIWLVFSFIN
ncbi:hypothetical protein BsWGS_16291 [Bradybaena similaris]